MGTSISAIIQVTTPSAGVPPGQITNLSATNITTTAVSLSWSAPSTGDPPITYLPQYAPAGPNPVWVSFPPPVSGTTATITGLTPNTAYQFQVVASNNTASTPSNTATATTLSVAPGAPTGLAVQGTPTQTSVALTWTAPTVGTPPLVYQALYRTPPGSGNFIGGPTSSSTSVNVTGLSPATAYDFEVVASNAAGTGPASAPLSNVMTATGIAVPTAPSNLASSDITSSGATISWSASTGAGPITYILQYRPH